MATRGPRDDRRGGAARLRRTLEERVAKLARAHVRIGVFGGVSGDGFQMPELAAVHEYGTKDGHVPARSYLRSTLEKKRDEIGTIAGKLGKAVMTGTMPARQALETLGQFVAAEVKKTITAGPPLQPPLAPSTVAGRDRVSGRGQKRKFKGPLLARPLVHTGQLVQSITHQVVDK